MYAPRWAEDVTPALQFAPSPKRLSTYGYPLVDSDRIQDTYFVDKDDKSYKEEWNQIKNIPTVYTPAGTPIQTPNSDIGRKPKPRGCSLEVKAHGARLAS